MANNAQCLVACNGWADTIQNTCCDTPGIGGSIKVICDNQITASPAITTCDYAANASFTLAAGSSGWTTIETIIGDKSSESIKLPSGGAANGTITAVLQGSSRANDCALKNIVANAKLRIAFWSNCEGRWLTTTGKLDLERSSGTSGGSDLTAYTLTFQIDSFPIGYSGLFP